MSAVRPPFSLAVRLFLLGAVIALVAVLAATWATVNATTVAVQEEQQESLHADAQAYDALVGYAATHGSWAGAQSLVDRLAGQHGGELTLTDPSGRVLATSADVAGPLAPGRARARIDPLDVDTALLATGEPETATEAFPVAAGGLVDHTLSLDARVPALTGAELAGLGPAVETCLGEAGLEPVAAVTRTLAVTVAFTGHRRQVAGCLDDALRSALSPSVAPPALLFVSGEGSRAEVFWDLSGQSQTRIAALAGGVLLVTLLLCALLAATIVSPLRRLATAAQRAGEGDLAARVPEGRRDEIGHLARAFNQMAERREQLEASRQRMVSDVSHELRTPLANVRGWVEAARDGVVAPDRALLDSLLEESLHLQRLVDDLHDLSLGDAGELRLEPEPIELPVFLAQVAASFGAAAQAAGVELAVEGAPGSAVEADPVRLRQAVANLVANALRHTARGGRVVLVGTPGRVAVRDDGEGIAPEELPHVFDRFRRVDPSRTRATGGSGLGLAIVRQIAEAHGGTASARSEPGVGTEVVLDLPLSASAARPGR